MHHPIQFQAMAKGIQEDRLHQARANQLASQAADKKNHFFFQFPSIQKLLVRSLSGIIQTTRIIKRGIRVQV